MIKVTGFLTFVMFRTYRANGRAAQDNGKVQKFARVVSHNGNQRGGRRLTRTRLADLTESQFEIRPALPATA